MAVYKRGETYWFQFVFDGTRIQKSTKQGNRKAAIDIEAAYRTKLAKGEVGLGEKKKAAPVPSLGEFLEKQFMPWAEVTFASKVKTRNYYRQGVRRLSEYKPLATRLLSAVTGEGIAAYIAKRQANGLEVSSINRELQALRRAFHLAVEWGVIVTAPKIKMLSGEARRERVVSSEDEARYLAAAPEPLRSIAIVLFDSGLRPEELFRLQWENLTWTNGRHGTLQVTHGKTAAARRLVPMTPRVRAVLEDRWKESRRPVDGWIWPAGTLSGHVEPSTIRKAHSRAFDVIAEHAKENDQKPVVSFVLYSARHTFLTRLGESGCDAWTLARIAGHSNIAMSARYVHPSNDAVLAAVDRLSLGASGQRLLQ
jgi:integrase